MNKLQEALAKLGNSPKEVYENLQAAGIRGRRRSCTHCPIARYLKKELGMSFVMVGNNIDVRPNPVKGETGQVFFNEPLTEPTRNFIRFFDRGNYSDVAE